MDSMERRACPTTLACVASLFVVVQSCPGFYHLVDLLVHENDPTHSVDGGLTDALNRNCPAIHSISSKILELEREVVDDVILWVQLGCE